jgi:hypothetical protein
MRRSLLAIESQSTTAVFRRGVFDSTFKIQVIGKNCRVLVVGNMDLCLFAHGGESGQERVRGSARSPPNHLLESSTKLSIAKH